MKSIVISGLVADKQLKEVCDVLEVDPNVMSEKLSVGLEFGNKLPGRVIVTAPNNQGLRRLVIEGCEAAAEFIVNMFITCSGAEQLFEGEPTVLLHEDQPLAELISAKAS